MTARRTALVTVLVLLASASARAGESIVIEATRLVPDVLRTTPGVRVDFVNRSYHGVHLEFGDDVRRHEVVQVPATGSIWAIFHRPGTHPYVVHIYDGRTVRALNGVVDVVVGDTDKWDSKTCGLSVMEICVEPMP